MFSLLTIGFLTAMRQEVTRMHKGWSLDTVTIDNQVLRSYKDDIRNAPTEVPTFYNPLLNYLNILGCLCLRSLLGRC